MRPLSGYRVLDLSRWIAGPHAALIMGDMGADVVKVETPAGDPSRLSGPHIKGESTYFMALNRSKRGIVLDLRNAAGVDVLSQLITEADVLIENFRPGTLESMGFTADRLRHLNPGLVTVSVSGYGQDGPSASRGCFDSVAQAVSGLQSLTGYQDAPPVRAGLYVADYSAALHAAIGALLALIARTRTGLGQSVDVALVESVLSMSATLIPGYLGAGVVPQRQGNRSAHAAPADIFATADGYLQLSASTNSLFRALAHAMDRADLVDDPRYASNQDRLENVEELTAEISRWAAGFSSAELEAKLVSAGVPAGLVADIRDVTNDEQLRHRGFLTSIEHPVAGDVTFAGPVVRLSQTPATTAQPSPVLGQHTHEVLREWLDIEEQKIQQLRKSGAFGAEQAESN